MMTCSSETDRLGLEVNILVRYSTTTLEKLILSNPGILEHDDVGMTIVSYEKLPSTGHCKLDLLIGQAKWT